jgi:leucyl-tRNA synthetase
VSASEFEVVVQVNGKRRASLTLPADVTEADATDAAKVLSAVTTALGGNEPKKVIYVPGKIVNFVV